MILKKREIVSPMTLCNCLYLFLPLTKLLPYYNSMYKNLIYSQSEDLFEKFIYRRISNEKNLKSKMKKEKHEI